MGFGKDGKGAILVEAPTEPLLTLAASTGLIISANEIGSGLLERFRVIKTEVVARVQIGTFVAGDGPLGLYLVDGDLSLAEFEEAIETVGPLGPNDSVSADRVERFNKLFGLINFVEENSAAGAMLNGGMPVEKTIRWTFARAKGWNWIVYNFGGALTTGASIRLQCKHFGVWVT